MKELSALLCLVIALAWPSVALPHALPVRLEPPDGAVLREMPATVSMHFDSQLEPVFSKLVVRNEGGEQVSSGNGEIDPHDRTTMVARISARRKGVYRVYWDVVSRDGHRAQGKFSFTVK
jgi:methionine-rich copper-binding protein CopC